MSITASIVRSAYTSHHGQRRRSLPPEIKQGNDMTDLNNDTCELNLSELEGVSGGNAIQDLAAQVAKTAAQIVTGNVGKCTDHWYSD
jgi:hypothetical protein